MNMNSKGAYTLGAGSSNPATQTINKHRGMAILSNPLFYVRFTKGLLLAYLKAFILIYI